MPSSSSFFCRCVSVLVASSCILVSCNPTPTLEKRQGRPIDTWRPRYPDFDNDPKNRVCNNQTKSPDPLGGYGDFQLDHAPAPTTAPVPVPIFNPAPMLPQLGPDSARNGRVQCQLVGWKAYRIPTSGNLENSGFNVNTQTVTLSPGTYSFTWDIAPGGLSSTAFVFQMRVYYATPGKGDWKEAIKRSTWTDGTAEHGDTTFTIYGDQAKNVHFYMELGSTHPYGTVALWYVPANAQKNPDWVFPT